VLKAPKVVANVSRMWAF